MQSSNSQRIQLQMGKLLLVGILISVVIVSIGGIYYLILHGYESIYQQTFYLQPPQSSTLMALLTHAWQLTPLGIIQFGVFFLMVIQLLRVLLVTWYFVTLRDKTFVLISLFIFIVVTYSLFWEF